MRKENKKRGEFDGIVTAEKLGLETSPRTNLCHYTSQEGLIGILEQKSMYATSAAYLNDSQEHLYAVNLAKRYFEEKGGRYALDMRNMLDRTENIVQGTQVYVASFSEESDLLSQWRGYCSKGSGFALCLSPDRMTRLASAHHWTLFKCVYDEAKQFEVLKKMEQFAIARSEIGKVIKPASFFGSVLLGFGTALKHPKFKEESEWRAILHAASCNASIRPGVSTLVPYIDFPLAISPGDRVELARLVVGPTPHTLLARRAALKLLSTVNAICLDTVSSEVPFRNW